MFHILVARFILEANENIPKKCDLNDVSLHFGQDCIAHLQLGDVFDRDPCASAGRQCGFQRRDEAHRL